MPSAVSHPSTLFISHGAPSLLLEAGPAHDFLAALGSSMPRPRAILVISAHWQSDSPLVESSPRPQTIHDFSGFPAALHAMRYPAPGSPDLAARICTLLAEAGLPCRGISRGLDHGAWVPLALMFPHADVPVVQLSLQPQLGPVHHLRLGRALESLPAQGVLVLGSGGATHNLGELSGADADTPEWTAAFDAWLAAAVERGDQDALVAYERQAPQARRNHPTPEHFLPLLVAVGAAGAQARGTILHRSTTYGTLSMAAFSFAALPVAPVPG